MTSELKPCSSCVGEAKLIKRSFYAGKESRLKSYRERVECKVCGLTTREYNKPNATVHSWNTRATPSADTLAGLVRYKFEVSSEGHPFMVNCDGGEYILHADAAVVIASIYEQLTKAHDVDAKALLSAIKRAEAAEAKVSELKLLIENERDQQVHEENKAIKAELAQIKTQEPVAWIDETGMAALTMGGTSTVHTRFESHKSERFCCPLYAAPVDQTAEIERLRGCLGFYANQSNWDNGKFESSLSEDGGHNVLTLHMSDAHKDHGAKARAALSGKEPS